MSRLIDADELQEEYKKHHDGKRLLLIDVAPTVEPQRIKGRWIKISPAGIYECSICGKNVMTSDIDAYDFCHGCGNPMEVIRDENQTSPNDEVN